MVVECGIRSSNEVWGNGTTEENSYNPVLRSTGWCFIESYRVGFVSYRLVVEWNLDREKRHTEEDESPCAIKVWVCKERCKEAICKLPSNSDAGIMTVVCCMDGWETAIQKSTNAKKLTHVWSNEYPLRKHPISKVLIEQSKVLDVCNARRAARDRLVDNQRAKKTMR